MSSGPNARSDRSGFNKRSYPLLALLLGVGALTVLAVCARFYQNEIIDALSARVGLAVGLAIYFLVLIVLAILLSASTWLAWRHPARRDVSGAVGALFVLSGLVSLMQVVNVGAYGLVVSDIYRLDAALSEWDDAELSRIADERVSIVGPIGPHLIRDFATLDDPSHPVKVIDITSEGGLVDQALELARQTERKGISVVVRGYCLSACILIAVASKDSYAEADAVFGFHRTSPVAEIESEIAKFSTDMLGQESAEFLSQHGVPDNVLVEAAKHGPDSVYPVTASEMVKFGAIKGIITGGQVIGEGSKR